MALRQEFESISVTLLTDTQRGSDLECLRVGGIALDRLLDGVLALALGVLSETNKETWIIE